MLNVFLFLYFIILSASQTLHVAINLLSYCLALWIKFPEVDKLLRSSFFLKY